MLTDIDYSSKQELLDKLRNIRESLQEIPKEERLKIRPNLAVSIQQAFYASEYELYRNELICYINENKIIALIDLHEMASNREQNICLGTGGEECLNLLGDHIKEQKLQEYFSSYFKNVTINKPFGAKYPFTVSRYISQNCNIPCVQVEINCNLFVNNLTTLKEIAKIFEGATNILVEKPNEKDIVSK